MPTITVQPDGKKVDVATNTVLLDALRLVGIEIDSPCGGEGACGGCSVRIVSGEVDFENFGSLTQKAVADGYVIACKTRILNSPVFVEVPKREGKIGGKFIDSEDNTFPAHWKTSLKRIC